MTDRERAYGLAHKAVLAGMHLSQTTKMADIVTDVMLEFAANEVETCVGDPTFRAEELREQIVGKR